MLNQLARLSVESDGRYATWAELQFIKDYLATVDHRMSAYEKIRDAEYQIMYEVTAQVRSSHPNIFMKGEQDLTTMAQRDCGFILKCAAAAMLIDDPDRLRDGLLLWHQTIIKALQTDRISQAMWQILPNVVQKYLSAEEAAVILPMLRLNQALLS
jgi:Phycobilisome protein